MKSITGAAFQQDKLQKTALTQSKSFPSNISRSKISSSSSRSSTGSPSPPPKGLLSALSSRSRLLKQDNKILVTVTVLGSAGPLRSLVEAHTTVEQVVEIALRWYAAQGRLPVLGSNTRLFELYCNDGEFQALEGTKWIGSLACRHFLLYTKKHSDDQDEEDVLHAPKMICWYCSAT